MIKDLYSKMVNYFIENPITSEKELITWAQNNLSRVEIQKVREIYHYLQNEGIIYSNGEYIIKRS